MTPINKIEVVCEIKRINTNFNNAVLKIEKISASTWCHTCTGCNLLFTTDRTRLFFKWEILKRGGKIAKTTFAIFAKRANSILKMRVVILRKVEL